MAAVITISGERQTGKTEMVIDQMVRHAQEGLKVAYIGHTLKCAHEVHGRIESRGDFMRSYRAHGEERVEFDSGGSIHFLAASKNSLRGFSFDVVVWDDVQKSLPSDAFAVTLTSARPRIYHVITE